jgi:hypothetical protein
MGREIGFQHALDEIPGHESDAVDESETGDTVRCVEVHGIDDGGAFEPEEALFDEELPPIGESSGRRR